MSMAPTLWVLLQLLTQLLSAFHASSGVWSQYTCFSLSASDIEESRRCWIWTNRKVSQKTVALTLMVIVFHLARASIQGACPLGLH